MIRVLHRKDNRFRDASNWFFDNVSYFSAINSINADFRRIIERFVLQAYIDSIEVGRFVTFAIVRLNSILQRFKDISRMHRSSAISIFLFSLLIAHADAGLSNSSRQTRADLCSNPPSIHLTFMHKHFTLFSSGNICNFIICENGGTCFQDSTTIDCFRCRCPTGFTGRVCDTQLVITRKCRILPVSFSHPVIAAGACNPACINGGTCMNNMCFCPPGFSDNFCQRRGISPLSHTSHASRSSYI